MTQTKTHTTSPKRMNEEETYMKAIVYHTYRRTAVLVGALFLISTATFIVSNVLMTPILGSHNLLAAVADHSQLMIAAATAAKRLWEPRIGVISTLLTMNVEI